MISAPAVSDQSERGGIIGAVAAICLWSAGNVMVVETPMAGMQIAFWRILLGAVVYSFAVYASRGSLTRAGFVASAPAGIVIGLEIGAFFVALKHTTVANVTVLAALSPLVLLAIAARRFGETVTRFLLAVTVVATAGVGLAIFGSTRHTSWSPKGDLLAIVAMFLFAAYLAMSKRARMSVPILEFQAWLWIVGATVLLPLAVVDAGGADLPTTRQWVWLLALLAVPGTGHMAMNWAHPRVRLVVASMLTLAVPVLSSLGAVAFLDESLGWVQVGGMTVVLVVLVAVVRRESRLLSPR